MLFFSPTPKSSSPIQFDEEYESIHLFLVNSCNWTRTVYDYSLQQILLDVAGFASLPLSLSPTFLLSVLWFCFWAYRFIISSSDAHNSTTDTDTHTKTPKPTKRVSLKRNGFDSFRFEFLFLFDFEQTKDLAILMRKIRYSRKSRLSIILTMAMMMTTTTDGALNALPFKSNFPLCSSQMKLIQIKYNFITLALFPPPKTRAAVTSPNTRKKKGKMRMWRAFRCWWWVQCFATLDWTKKRKMNARTGRELCKELKNNWILRDMTMGDNGDTNWVVRCVCVCAFFTEKLVTIRILISLSISILLMIRTPHWPADCWYWLSQRRPRTDTLRRHSFHLLEINAVWALREAKNNEWEKYSGVWLSNSRTNEMCARASMWQGLWRLLMASKWRLEIIHKKNEIKTTILNLFSSQFPMWCSARWPCVQRHFDDQLPSSARSSSIRRTAFKWQMECYCVRRCARICLISTENSVHVTHINCMRKM